MKANMSEPTSWSQTGHGANSPILCCWILKLAQAIADAGDSGIVAAFGIDLVMSCCKVLDDLSDALLGFDETVTVDGQSWTVLHDTDVVRLYATINDLV